MYIQDGHKCKGCGAFDRSSSEMHCVIYEIGRYRECPCLTCIVKVMCDKACEPYFDIRRIADGQLHGS